MHYRFEGNKTPGEGGFTIEFHKTFFGLIGQDLVASFNAAYKVMNFPHLNEEELSLL